MRRAVAFLFHAPGLRLFYGERLPRALVRPNLLAIAATVAATLAVAVLDGRPALVIATWLIGHVAWGAYLAWKLP